MSSDNNVENLENVNVDNGYAAYQKRIYAFLFDLGLALLTSIGPYFIFDGNDMHVDFFYMVCIFFFLINVSTYLQSGGERSPGDNYFRIKVVKLDTLKGSKLASIMRIFLILIMVNLLYLDTITGIVLLIVNIAQSIHNRDYKNKKQLFWDILTKTVVLEIK